MAIYTYYIYMIWQLYIVYTGDDKNRIFLMNNDYL